LTLHTGNVVSKKLNRKVPLKTTANENDGLSITFTKVPGIDYVTVCKRLSFAVHKVDEIPVDFERFEVCEIRHGMVLDVLITPEVLETDEDLRSFSVDERQCYMEGERKLKFFKKYSVRNCEMECISMLTLEQCGCVPFYGIRNSTTKICGVTSYMFDCISSVVVDVNLKEDSELNKRCNCLPTCNNLNYKLEYFYNNIANKDVKEELDTITINFRYKNGDFMPQRRYQQLPIFSFMAESAGLLGLYCGVSILTIVELFYFLTFRPITNFVRQLRRRV
jgi:acid-sensing ion channel, other